MFLDYLSAEIINRSIKKGNRSTQWKPHKTSCGKRPNRGRHPFSIIGDRDLAGKTEVQSPHATCRPLLKYVSVTMIINAFSSRSCSTSGNTWTAAWWMRFQTQGQWQPSCLRRDRKRKCFGKPRLFLTWRPTGRKTSRTTFITSTTTGSCPSSSSLTRDGCCPVWVPLPILVQCIRIHLFAIGSLLVA